MMSSLSLLAVVRSSLPEQSYTSNYLDTYFWSSFFTCIVLSFIVALLRYLFYPAWIIAKEPINYEERVLLVPTRPGERVLLPVVQQPPILSIVIPAYNEESRLLSMMEITIQFLQKEQETICSKLRHCCTTSGNTSDTNGDGTNTGGGHCSIEFIIVDDGSTDRTCSIIQEDILPRLRRNGTTTKDKSSRYNNYSLKLLQLQTNRGKGAAVQLGVLHSTGNFILMVDADGATDTSDLLKLITALNGILLSTSSSSSSSNNPQLAVAFGSRAHLEDTAAVVARSRIRTILMWAFHMCVAALCSRKIRDTQCGFKLFTAHAAKLLFSNLHLQRWAFDIELVTIAQSLSIPIVEVGVQWREVDGSKLDTGSKWSLLVTSLGMLRDMICVRLCYSLGIWKLKQGCKIDQFSSSYQ
jgi:dolichyl-phosphate beta-glucosyltransferase